MNGLFNVSRITCDFVCGINELGQFRCSPERSVVQGYCHWSKLFKAGGVERAPRPLVSSNLLASVLFCQWEIAWKIGREGMGGGKGEGIFFFYLFDVVQ